MLRFRPGRAGRAPPGVVIAGLIGMALSLSGCTTLSYYAQSVAGQLRLIAPRQPVDELIRDPHTAEGLRERLLKARAIRDFASRELALPDNASYRGYVDLGRRYVVWSVIATPEFSLSPRTWCFPVAGCVSYRGYFAESDARRFGAALSAEGMDVYVAGVEAYSTLGWFADPLLNTMLAQPDWRLAGTLFHELAHQRLYVSGDTAFNEAFAVTVEREGLRRWFVASGESGQQARYRRVTRRRQAFLELLGATRQKLNQVYESTDPDPVKRRAKRRVFTELRADYARLKAHWGGDGRYDGWFKLPLNNARLALVATYNAQVPALQRLLAQSGGDLATFYAACDGLARLDEADRQARLRRLAGEE